MKSAKHMWLVLGGVLLLAPTARSAEPEFTPAQSVPPPPPPESSKADLHPLLTKGSQLLARVQEVPTVAYSEKDLNALLASCSALLQELSAARSEPLPDFRLLQTRLGTAQIFLRYWSNFASAEASKDYATALSCLNTLIADSSYGQFAPPPLLSKRQKELEALINKEFETTLQALKTIISKKTSIEELRAARDELQALHNKYYRSGVYRSPQQDLSQALESVNKWIAFSTQADAQNWPGALDHLNQLESNSYRDPQWIPASLLASRKKEIETSANKEIETVFKTHRDRLSKEITLESLRAAKDELQLLNNRYARYGNLKVNQLNLSQSVDALNYWMPVIAHEENAHYQTALEQLNRLEEGSHRDSPIIPYQVLLTKKASLMHQMIKTPPSLDDPILTLIDAELAKTPSVDDLLKLQPLIAQFAGPSYPARNRAQRELSQLAGELQSLASAKADFESRQFFRLVTPGYRTTRESGSRWLVHIEKYINDYRLKSVIVLYQLQDAGLDPQNGPIDEQLVKAADRFAQQGDWENVYDVLDAYRALTGSQSVGWILAEMHGTLSYLQARNLEKAGLLPEALALYTQTLSQYGKRIPFAEAQARVDALKNSHPELFEMKRLPSGNLR